MYYNSPFDCTAIIRDFKVIQTKKHEDMAFIDIEALEGHKDLVIFPSIYNKVKGKIKKDKTMTFTLRKKYNGDQDSYIIENIKPYKEKVS
jgi:DNA polymerase III alpha subunit